MLVRMMDAVIARGRKIPAERSLLVGISGIDAGGKGYLTARLAAELENMSLNVANINIDGWLNLPAVRFRETAPAANFYEHGLRFDEMFENLVLPLKRARSISLLANFADETAVEFRPHEYRYENIDVILLEGIFLFKKRFRNYFDLRIWIECSFEVALERAVARSQEDLSPADTCVAYETIYFPAQRLHFDRDQPQRAADLIWPNF